MEFMSRGLRPNRQGQPSGGQSAPAHEPQTTETRRPAVASSNSSAWLRISSGILFISMALLLAAVAASIAFRSTEGEGGFVQKDQMQVVVMNNDQQPPYFGKITKITDKYVVLTDVWYLLSAQQVQPGSETQNNNLEVRKLGCEIHGPADQMFINRSEVLYWENLKNDGRIPQEIANYKQNNPDYAACNPQAGAGGGTNTNTQPTNTEETTATENQ